MKKRFLGILLSFALMLTMLPVLGLSLTAYATSSTNYVLTFSVTGAEKPGSITTTLPCTLTKADWLDLAGLDPASKISDATIAAGDKDYLSLDKGSGRLSINKPFEGSKSISDVSEYHHTVRITCEVIKEPVPYIDADGSKKSCTDYTVVEGSDTHVVWGEQNKTTWYVVNDNVTISDGVEIDGNVNLILCDGAKLTVVNGIYRGNYSLSITIYAQSTSGSMGSLESSSPFYTADVTINGGAINARGIEGTNTVTINGGTVNTNGGTNRPGIYTESSTVTINGGEVYTESEKYYGIEGAYGNGTVTINGGTVTAIGKDKAINGTLHNAIAGTGWTNVEGTEGKTAIEVKEEGQKLDEKIKKVQFPAVVDKVTVSFDSAGGSAVAAQTIAKGAKATKPADPTKNGFTFDGWYKGDAAFSFDTPVDENITLTAHWKQIPTAFVARAVAVGNNKINVRCNTYAGADRYLVRFDECGKSGFRYSKTLDNKTRSLNISGFKKGRTYKMIVYAQKKSGSGYTTIVSSNGIHVIAGTSNDQYTNPGKVTLGRYSGSMPVGKTYDMKVSVIKAKAGKELLGKGHGPKLTYKSSNNKVAKVSKNGRVYAVGKGTCKIYAISISGVYQYMNLRVR